MNEEKKLNNVLNNNKNTSNNNVVNVKLSTDITCLSDVSLNLF